MIRCLDVMESITTTEPRPPRQIDDTIPKELERICLKALSKRAHDRYTTAKDMAEDLAVVPPDRGRRGLAWRPAASRSAPHLDQPWNPLHSRPHPGNPTPTSGRSRSFPRGCDRSTSMTPTSSWNCFPDLGIETDCPTASGSGRRKIEQIDPDMTFKVGLIYGPSGCGKSSLVKAGLLAPARQARPAGLHRGDPGGDGNSAAEGPAQGLS